MPNNAKHKGETLEESIAIMRDATVTQLRDALAAHRRGERIGCFADAIRPFLACAVEGE